MVSPPTYRHLLISINVRCTSPAKQMNSIFIHSFVSSLTLRLFGSVVVSTLTFDLNQSYTVTSSYGRVCSHPHPGQGVVTGFSLPPPPGFFCIWNARVYGRTTTVKHETKTPSVDAFVIFAHAYGFVIPDGHRSP